jgi:hypothetical protein
VLGRQNFAIVICGSRATLAVGPGGWRIFGQEA